MNFQFQVRFETVSDELVKAYVNDRYVGRVTFRGDDRVMFRCSDNPFKNVVPHCRKTICHETVTDAINDEFVYRQLVPIVIRNYIRNYIAPSQPQVELAA